MAMAIRSDVLRELMKDKDFAEKLLKTKKWHQAVEVIREFAEKKGYECAEVYIK